MDEGRQLNGVEGHLVVAGCRPIAAQRHLHPRCPQLGHGRQTAAQPQVGGRVVHHHGSGFRQGLGVLGLQPDRVGQGDVAGQKALPLQPLNGAAAEAAGQHASLELGFHQVGVQSHPVPLRQVSTGAEEGIAAPQQAARPYKDLDPAPASTVPAGNDLLHQGEAVPEWRCTQVAAAPKGAVQGNAQLRRLSDRVVLVVQEGRNGNPKACVGVGL